MAAALLANEEYLLGRRLQQQDDRRGLDEVPSYLSLLVFDSVPDGRSSPLLRPGRSPHVMPSSTGTRHADQIPPTEGRVMGSGPGSGGGDVFECAASLFYNVSRTAKTSVHDATM